MEQLKKSRKYLRGQATKLLNNIDDLAKKPEYKLQLNTLKIQLESKREELKRLDKDILASTPDSDPELVSELETADSYEFNIIEGIQRINVIVGTKEEKEKKDESVHVRVKEAHLTARLPKIELQKFNGNIIHWMSFWQSFEATIHNRQELSPIEKLNYLISLLQGEAAQAIEGFALTAENYEDIIKVLKDRYGNTERILEHHIRKFLNLKPVKDASNLGELRRLITEISTHIRTLKNLKMPPSRCSEILNTRIKELVPDEIMILYERQRKEEICNTDDLIDFLNKEMQVREKVKLPTALDPTASVFKPRSRAPLSWKNPPFFAPRTGVRRPRPWTWRVPGQQGAPRLQ